MEAWYQNFADKSKKVNDLLMMIDKSFGQQGSLSVLKEALDGIVSNYDNSDSRSFGRWLSKQEGKVVNGLRFVRSKKKTGGVTWWKVEKIPSGLSGSSGVEEPVKNKKKIKKKNIVQNHPTETTNLLLDD